jgi:hypothetical protein
METPEPIKLLRIALANSDERIKAIRDFQSLMYKSEGVLVSEEVDEALHELAYDLEFYVPVTLHRAQDRSYFGDRKAKELIRAALTHIESLGIE